MADKRTRALVALMALMQAMNANLFQHIRIYHVTPEPTADFASVPATKHHALGLVTGWR